MIWQYLNRLWSPLAESCTRLPGVGCARVDDDWQSRCVLHSPNVIGSVFESQKRVSRVRIELGTLRLPLIVAVIVYWMLLPFAAAAQPATQTLTSSGSG